MHGSDIVGLLGAGVSIVFTLGIVLFSVVVSVVAMVVPLGIVFLVFRAFSQAAAAERKLLQTGVSAPARIVSVGQTGLYVNNQPQVRIALEVAPPGGETFQAQVDKIISMVQIPQVQPGLVVEVRYDPASPKRVAIVGL